TSSPDTTTGAASTAAATATATRRSGSGRRRGRTEGGRRALGGVLRDPACSNRFRGVPRPRSVMALYDDPRPHEFPYRAIRRLLETPGNLADLLAEVLPDLAGRFDCARAELVNREFRLENWQQHELDLLFRVPFRTGQSEQPALV